MSIKDKLFAAFDKLGNTNGHSCPESQDPAVALIHEYNVATHGESYFKKRREVAKTKMLKVLSGPQTAKVNKIVKGVKENEVGDSTAILETDAYILSLDVKNGASFVDMQKLKVELCTKHKFNTTQVEALFEQCTDRREPSQSWRVVER